VRFSLQSLIACYDLPMTASALITMMTRAARNASKSILRDFGEVDKLQISKKGTANFVTSADLRAEQKIIEELRKARPAYGYLTEETGIIEGKDAKTRFVIDPIDGTTNFIYAIPYICTAIACEKLNDLGVWEPVAAVVYDPIHDELFHAEKGQGAFLNNYRIKVSDRTQDRLVSTAAPRKWKDGYAATSRALERVTSDDSTVVRCGGAAALDLAYVAAGRMDGMWYHALQWWDMSAGILLVKEAGGIVTTLDGNAPSEHVPHIVAASAVMHETLLACVRN
jgi:myo-inositol-1(or 4)-monophosphatase